MEASSRVESLASRLAAELGDPLPDAMAAEWIVVPSAGMQRWLKLELSRHLGSSGEGRTDGVAANMDLLFPGALTRRLLSPGTDHDTDPWELERVAWAVLNVLAGSDPDDERLGSLLRPVAGATAWGRARRLADLFDRYLLHRPQMIQRWTTGDDVDGSGMPLPERASWQPHLWRLVRSLIGQPSPAETRSGRIEAFLGGSCPEEVPPRVSLFGLTTIPGGAPFLELLDALATQREVHLFLHQPSPTMTERVRTVLGSPGSALLQRFDHTTGSVVRHPLLRSWARPAREAGILLGERLAEATPAAGDESYGGEQASGTLLVRLQDDIRRDVPPAGDFSPSATDHSVRIHSCHGPTRQVEVLRDQILHLLVDDPSLTEDDIVVMCPALEEFAPLIESVFGPSATVAPLPAANEAVEVDAGPPSLAYRLTDRSLGTTYPLLGALASLVELLSSRFSDAAVLDFANLEPVRQRFGFTHDDLTHLVDWIEAANTRWGLNGEHRKRWGIPATYETGTWRHALDRLLLGIAVSDDPTALASGEVLPIAVEGADMSIIGRFADMLGRLTTLAEAASLDRPARAWTELLQRASEELLAVDDAMSWQRTRLMQVLERIADQAAVSEEAEVIHLTLADVRHVLGNQLDVAAGRADFFRGGITISSFVPMRGLPFKVVCLLGMDEQAFAVGAPDGDDLVTAAPRIGDRDPRTDTRAALLEAVLATGSHLVLIRSDRNVVTNQPIPTAVIVAELRDVIEATLDPACRKDALGRVEIIHPRQGFDEDNFVTFNPTCGKPGYNKASIDGPWSFDPLARDGARVRTSDRKHVPFLSDRLDPPEVNVIDLADLREFIHLPVRYFLRRVLHLQLPDNPARKGGGRLVATTPGVSGVPRAAEGRGLLLDLDPLECWKLEDRLLDHLFTGGDIETFIHHELARDALPPGRLADAVLAETVEKVIPLREARRDLGMTSDPPGTVAIDVSLADGTRVVGAIRDDGADRPGPITVTVSAYKDKQRPIPWLDMLALTANDPTREWQSVIVNPTKDGAGYKARSLSIPNGSPSERRDAATLCLALVVDLFRRGHREPLPLFPTLSPALYKGKSTSGKWRSFGDGRADGDDEWVQLAFGCMGHEEILALPCLHDDPPGTTAFRAQRYAQHLWGAIEDSLTPRADPGDRS